MKRSFMAVASAAAVLALGSAPTAAAYGGPNPNPKAVENCDDTIMRQTEQGVSAGGGPKAGIPAPTNCDHFFHSAPGQA
jgi:hypothetical protein